MSGPSTADDWLLKAGSDLDLVRRALIADPHINAEGAAYHCQQAAEKAIKALLTHFGVRFPMGGARGTIFSSSRIPEDHELCSAASALTYMGPWATAWRYPQRDTAIAAPLPTSEDLTSAERAVLSFFASVEVAVFNQIGSPLP